MQSLEGKSQYFHHQPLNLTAYSTGIDDAEPFGNRVLSSLPGRILTRLRPHLKRVKLEKDDLLYLQGDPIRSIYFPETAVISEFEMTEDGRVIEVSSTGNEGLVGVFSAFWTATAINCTQVCVGGTAESIESTLLEGEIESSPVLRNLLYKQLSLQMEDLSRSVVCNMFHSAEQRLCTWLLQLEDRCPDRKFRLTHEDVARVLGIHRPSVTFIEQSLRERGLIEYSRGRIRLANRAGLEEAACRCYAEFKLRTSKAFHGNETAVGDIAAAA